MDPLIFELMQQTSNARINRLVVRKIYQKENTNENVKKAIRRGEVVASFLDFTRPKTALQLRTEHGLTSEFGTGSGGTHALWPATTQGFPTEAYILLAYKTQNKHHQITVIQKSINHKVIKQTL